MWWQENVHDETVIFITALLCSFYYNVMYQIFARGLRDDAVQTFLSPKGAHDA